MLYKYQPLDIIHTFEPPSINDLPSIRYKYCSPDIVEDSTSYIKHVISKVPKLFYKYCLIDIKVDDLIVGQLPTNANYHTDLSLNPNNSVHFLYVSGVSCTEFVTQDVSIFSDRDQDIIKELNSKCESMSKMSIKPLALYKYGSGSIHRASPAYENGKRLLIRVSYSDTFKPRNIIIK